MSIVGILDAVPHRAPALILDEVVGADDESACCAFTVREGFFVDDGRLAPEALIEALAQTAAVMGGLRARRHGAALLRGLLAGVRGFSIERTPAVGDRVVCRVQTVRRLGEISLVNGFACDDDGPICAGEFKFHETLQ